MDTRRRWGGGNKLPHCLTPHTALLNSLFLPALFLPAEQVMGMFSAAGEVVMVRIRKPDQPEPLLTKGLRSEVSQ